ncbi:MAG: S24 family peptidase, partial [Sphingomonadaceae bacterium]|nr:S24 family peptidase [Sphingomonadaceae bacterium]
YDVLASAGAGALAEEGRVLAEIGLPEKWLRRLASGRPADLSIISVRGDSMAPTLADGDDILVDRADAGARLRDGIYVLRMNDALIVKRVAMSPVARRFAIRSDNPAWPSWEDCGPGDVEAVGRVVWMSRRLV